MSNEKIITKIEKLLALAGNNPSEQEAQAAMLKANHMLRTGASTYTVAKELGRPQCTVWWHFRNKLECLDPSLYQEVLKVLKSNYKGGGR